MAARYQLKHVSADAPAKKSRLPLVIIAAVLAVLVVAGGVFLVIHLLNNSPSRSSSGQSSDGGKSWESPDQPASDRSASADEADPAKQLPEVRIGIVQHGIGKDSASCYDGFIEQLGKRKMLENADITYIIENSDEKCIEAIQQLVDDKVDLLYTIGPFASKYAAAATDEIPIVFAAVTDPEEMGLVESNEAPGGNVTGVSSYTPCFEQIDLIPILLPECKSVATIYSSTDVNAVRQAIIACWEAEDFDYTADRYPVSDAEGILKALEDIYDKGTDVIYLPIDRLIRDNLENIIDFSHEYDVPVVCGNRAMMMQGCLATCEINYESIGRRAADLCCDILYSEKDPASLSVIYKYDCHNIVNRQAMELLGIELSNVARANVEIVDAYE